MFGHSEIGSYAFGEFPALRTVFAILCRVFVVPRYRAKVDLEAAYTGHATVRPR